jgi:hypothetical protein
VRWLTGRVRRRGGALLFFALLDLVFGSQLALKVPELRAIPMYAWADTILPLGVWAVIWLGVGVLCAVQAFVTTDRLAFTAAAILKAAWGCVAVTGWLSGQIPRGYTAAVVWIAFSGFVLIIATWPEVDPPEPTDTP